MSYALLDKFIHCKVDVNVQVTESYKKMQKHMSSKTYHLHV